MNPELKKELYILFGWLSWFDDPRIGIIEEGGCLYFYNTYVHQSWPFELDNLPAIKGINNLLCLWANSNKSKIYNSQGESIDDYESLDELSKLCPE